MWKTLAIPGIQSCFCPIMMIIMTLQKILLSAPRWLGSFTNVAVHSSGAGSKFSQLKRISSVFKVIEMFWHLTFQIKPLHKVWINIFCTYVILTLCMHYKPNLKFEM